MATRRRIGVSVASTEAARRQLMQPVPSWEKVWVTPTAGSPSFKVYKWVKTEKFQQFDDEEGEVDEPLAPLPDDPEIVEGEEDEQDETRNESTQQKDVDLDDRPSEVPPSPKPQLTLTQSNSELDVTVNDDDGLHNEPSLKLDASVGEGNVDDGNKGLELDMSGLGPDALQLESAHDLSQLDSQDPLIGGPLMDEGTDPFVAPT